jgi:hypothetical protein
MNDSVFSAGADQLTRAQGKITYLGEQSKPIPTVLFFSEGFVSELDKFFKMQTDPTPYDNDMLPSTLSFTVSPAEFHRILQSVKPVLEVLDPSAQPEFLSFTVAYSTDSDWIGQEFRLDYEQGAAFYTSLIGALGPDNDVGREAVTKQYRNVYPEDD